MKKKGDKVKSIKMSTTQDIDRSLSPLPSKLPVFSGEPKTTSWQSFIAKFRQNCKKENKWSSEKKLVSLIQLLDGKRMRICRTGRGKR